jgi:sugar lactone lactonase YvrE
MKPLVFDARKCALGEGPLWHPARGELFWFDILGKRLLAQGGQSWQFDAHVSAAGWIDRDRVLIASETGLFIFDLVTSERTHVVDVEADNPVTRSNDGRADPFGGFWIGTMGKNAEQGAGAIYRFYKGELRCLFGGITISNSICFSPDRLFAYFADTPTQVIKCVHLDDDGWPVGAPETYVDLRSAGVFPDGSVVDAEGCLWNAQWGAHRVARYGRNGQFLDSVTFPAKQISCPAFGGRDLKTLYATSAAIGLDGAFEGQTFSAPVDTVGQREYSVLV